MTRAKKLSPIRCIELLLLIRGLDCGGAERQLLELVRGLDKTKFSVTIACFYDGGNLRALFEDVPRLQLEFLHKKGRWDIVRFLWRWWKLLAKKKPDIVHGYMGIANELSLMGKLVGAKVVWGLRASFIDLALYDDWLVRWSFLLAAKLSFLADKIIVNSRAGKRYYLKKGYCRRRMRVISNGIDTDYFSPAQIVREGKNVIIGVVARLDPVKDHVTFLKAASLLVAERNDIRFVCAGDGPVDYRKRLQALAQSLGLENRLLWAGVCDNMPDVYNAFDIAVCCSSGEGFPNVVAEAMACGVPCVVTDVGDAGRIVGNTGKVVAPGEPVALARSLGELIDMPKKQRRDLGKKARARIVENFSRERLLRETEGVLLNLPCRYFQ